MEWLFGERLHDDDQRSGLHQALRVAIVMPADDPKHPPDAALRAFVPDLDMMTRDVDAHRGDPAATRRAMAIVWGLGWLGYLALVRVQGEPALDEVLVEADLPWWK